MIRGVPTTEHWRVGRVHRILQWAPLGPLVAMRRQSSAQPYTVGVCVSVTYWGSNRVRWVRLRHHDGTEKSYAPGVLVAEDAPLDTG